MEPKRCRIFTGSFSSHFHAGRSVDCRLCLTRQRLETSVEEQEGVEAGQNKIEEFSHTVASSHDLIQANVAVVNKPPLTASLPSAVPSTPTTPPPRGSVAVPLPAMTSRS